MLVRELVLTLHLLFIDLGYTPVITSGYRPSEHPLEHHKHKPGTHSQGIAVDLRCRSDCRKIADLAKDIGFTGIGIYDRHIHLDIRKVPATWYGKSQ